MLTIVFLNNFFIYNKLFQLKYCVFISRKYSLLIYAEYSAYISYANKNTNLLNF